MLSRDGIDVSAVNEGALTTDKAGPRWPDATSFPASVHVELASKQMHVQEMMEAHTHGKTLFKPGVELEGVQGGQLPLQLKVLPYTFTPNI